MTKLSKKGKRKYKIDREVLDEDNGDIGWNVIDSSDESIVASFYGGRFNLYARMHAKMLNSLPKKDQP
jgi:hypothetical protein